MLEAVALAGPAALAAELEGTHLPAAELPAEPTTELAECARRPCGTRRRARRSPGAPAHPVRTAGRVASVELYRAGLPFGEAERLAAELAAGQVALVLRAFAPADPAVPLTHPALELAGEALAAALGAGDTAAELARVAANVVGAPVGLIWDYAESGFRLAGAFGIDEAADLREARELAQAALDEPGPVRAVAAGQLPGACVISTALPLGQPPVGLLQLLFAAGDEPDATQLARLTTFGVRAAQALRADRARPPARARARPHARAPRRRRPGDLGAVARAHARDLGRRVAALLGIERVALYLRAEENRLVPAAARGLVGPARARRGASARSGARPCAQSRNRDRRGRLARRPARRRPRRSARGPTSGGARRAAPRARRDRRPARGLPGSAGACRRERGGDARRARGPARRRRAERAAARARDRVGQAARGSPCVRTRRGTAPARALRDLASFAQELSLEKTLEALATTVVDVLDVDAAVIAMPDDRRELPHAARDPREATRSSPTPHTRSSSGPSRSARQSCSGCSATRTPYRLRARATSVLEPFLAKGWTAAVVPVATPAETIAALTIFSFRPGQPDRRGHDRGGARDRRAGRARDRQRAPVPAAEGVRGHDAALAAAARSRPTSPGLEVGEVYESSARVDVGGDIYDFLELDDGRLAVVLGDVTGHGVEATADMAMAKFVFRSLAREHPEPGDFLAYANDVVVDEIAPGKFITMAYLAVDPAKGEVACASAGHPPPRLVLAGRKRARARGAAASCSGSTRARRTRRCAPSSPLGATIVLYTDGVVEARRRGELYGTERLDALLAAQRELAPRELAHAVTEDARSYCRRRAERRPRRRRHPPNRLMELLRGERDVVRVGHRGAAALAPENSLEAIEAAAAHGVDVVELDVARGGDGDLVLAHGPSSRPDAPPARRRRSRSRLGSAWACSST